MSYICKISSRRFNGERASGSLYPSPYVSFLMALHKLTIRQAIEGRLFQAYNDDYRGEPVFLMEATN